MAGGRGTPILALPRSKVGGCGFAGGLRAPSSSRDEERGRASRRKMGGGPAAGWSRTVGTPSQAHEPLSGDARGATSSVSTTAILLSPMSPARRPSSPLLSLWPPLPLLAFQSLSLTYSPQDSPVALQPNAAMSLAGPRPESPNHPRGPAPPSACVLLERVRVCWANCVPEGPCARAWSREVRGAVLCVSPASPTVCARRS